MTEYTNALIAAAYEDAAQALRDNFHDGHLLALTILSRLPDEARAALAEAERKAWEAGRDAALEAAKAEMLPDTPDNDEDRAYNMAVQHISDVIAALKKEPEA